MQQQVPAGLLAKPVPLQASTSAQPPQPAQTTAAGDPDGPARIDPLAAAIGQAVNGALVPVLTQMLPAILGDTLASALRTVTPRRDKCAECLRERIMWGKNNQTAVDAAMLAACQHHGIAPGDPRTAQLDAMPFLPEELRPGSGHPQSMPPIRDSVTVHQGESKCAEHLVPEASGRRPFLVVNGPVTPAMLSQLQ